MTRHRDQLIGLMTDELAPVSRPGTVYRQVLLWLLVSLCFAVLAMLMVAPVRPGALDQLVSAPRFAGEMMLGMAAIVMLTIALFCVGIPGHPHTRRALVSGLLLLVLWVTTLAVELFYPVLPASTVGERHHCYLEVMLWSQPMIILGAVCWQRLVVSHALLGGALLGLTSGFAVAVLMSLFCVAQPGHDLVFHMLPVLVTALAGAAINGLMARST